MRYCPYCEIKIGGTHEKCPLCQSKLSGEAGERFFPAQNALKLTSLFYRMQLFIVSVIVIVSLGVDFLFHVDSLPGINGIPHHWSLIVCMWLLVFEFGIIRLYKGKNSSRILTLNVFIVMVMLVITTYFTGGVITVLSLVVPVALMATMLTNFILAMVDRSGNAMVYLLSNLLVGILPYIAF
nr:hypothetical protein [Eubacterium sp.]